MPKLQNERQGDSLMVKGAQVEFSYFPTTKTTRRAGLQTKAYTTDAWSIIHASTRRISPKSTRKSAAAFAEQAHEFYLATQTSSTIRAKPLLLYYAFLNLSKSLCLCRGNTKVIGQAQHGLSEVKSRGASLKNAKLKATPSAQSKISMFDEFREMIGENRLTKNEVYRVHDLIGCSLIGHRLWCTASNRGDRFLRLHPIEIRHDRVKKLIWLRAWMQCGARTKSNITNKDIAAKGFDRAWKQVSPLSPDTDSNSILWEQTKPIRYTGRPSDKLDELIKSARSILYRSLTVTEPFRNYYVHVPPKRFKKHHQMVSRYTLLYFLGSVTRYHPADSDDYMTSEFGPFLSEFLASEPSQMLFEMASLFSGREVVSVGLA